jgi:hypothetical protein
MAIGDAIGVKLGTATTNYQPSSGIEVQITSFHKGSTTDALTIYDGSDATDLVGNSLSIASDIYPSKGWMNSGLMITNNIYLRKTGTTDYVYITGVQTNA